MDIRPPYGYQQIVPLTRAHRVVLQEGRTLPAAFRALTALPLSFTEFAPASRDYPIAFISSDGGTTFFSMAILGLENRENLFVSAENRWEAGAYMPAYVRRYPFCMTKVTVDGQEQPQRIACVEKSAISDRGSPLHDAKGEPLALWEERKKLVFEFEADLARTEGMCRAVCALGLLEPFAMRAVPNQGAPLQMAGMHRISEEKLNGLAAEKLKELAQSGHLARIYCHLMSLGNFARLLDRHVARTASAEAGPVSVTLN